MKREKRSQPTNQNYVKSRTSEIYIFYRKGPSTSYDSYGYIEPGVYTIVDEQDGWGLLKAYAQNRNGWIKLSYTTKL